MTAVFGWQKPRADADGRTVLEAAPSASRAALVADALEPTRWVVLAAALLLAVAQPIAGSMPVPAWVFLLVFIGYDLARVAVSRARGAAAAPLRAAAADMLFAGALYTQSATPIGPLYLVLLLAVVCAAAALPRRSGLALTGTAVLLLLVAGPTLPLWTGTSRELRELGAGTITLALAGIGTSLVVERLERELERGRAARDEARQMAALDRLRTDFIAAVSHHLRTPLTATRASLGLLELSARAQLAPDHLRLLENARRNVARLDMHINDLLALNQITAGALQPEATPFELCALVEDVASALQPLLQSKRQTLTLHAHAPIALEADPRQIEQVVTNLLANAHEHTPAGTCITLVARPAGAEIVLLVGDDGPGIPIEAQERIFQPFQRIGGMLGGSSGLGLAIVKGIIDLHGGRVWVESRPGSGTVFHIVLPARIARRGQ